MLVLTRKPPFWPVLFTEMMHRTRNGGRISLLSFESVTLFFGRRMPASAVHGFPFTPGSDTLFVYTVWAHDIDSQPRTPWIKHYHLTEAQFSPSIPTQDSQGILESVTIMPVSHSKMVCRHFFTPRLFIHPKDRVSA